MDNTQQEMAQLAAARDAESSCADLLARGFTEMSGHASAERQQRMEAQAALGAIMHTVVVVVLSLCGHDVIVMLSLCCHCGVVVLSLSRGHCAFMLCAFLMMS